MGLEARYTQCTQFGNMEYISASENIKKTYRSTSNPISNPFWIEAWLLTQRTAVATVEFVFRILQRHKTE
uniref:Uncharacterized protein n=1 Tax=Physcomitrium patens TaxID=3218 RepID=A0A2K1KM43_PHYPA|nr:hypothetical protein PHYPA_005727 [Physcomitrium patens]